VDIHVLYRYKMPAKADLVSLKMAEALAREEAHETL